MALDSKTLMTLESAAKNFSTKNHQSFLAQAMQSIGETQNPVAALELLQMMRGSSFANRGKPEDALNEVGKWLEDRLYREPTIDVHRIELELGWLRRLSVIAEYNARLGGQFRENREHRSREMPRLSFGSRIDAIKRQRAEAKRAHVEIERRQQAAKPVAPPPLIELPDVFQVDFKDIKRARDARHTLRERQKKKKPIHATLIELIPTDARLIGLAANLYCSTTETEGFLLPLERTGLPQPFYVRSIEARDGKKVARLIILTAELGEKK